MVELARIARHDLVWAGDIGPVAASLRAAGNEADAELLRAWTTAGRPFVVSRQPEDLPESLLALGLPLPPSQGKRRVTLHLPVSAVMRHRPALALSEAAAAAPAAWRGPLAELLAQDALPPLRVFGSLAWQAITGLAYVGPASDLDLSWEGRQAARREAACAALQRWQQASGIPVDGELWFDQGRAVSFREWMRASAAGGGMVLVKHLRGACLMDMQELLRETAPC